MRNAFKRLISRLDTRKKRVSKFEDRSIGTSKTEMQKEKGMKRNRIFKNHGTISKGIAKI